MRLLNVETMKVEEYFGAGIPDYAILSHCWGEEEVLFSDVNRLDWRKKRGARKIEYSISQCWKDDISYIWIDTCCIDKTSSAELSEAINSMYRWYERSKICYAYLDDVEDPSAYRYPDEDIDEDMDNCSINGVEGSIKSVDDVESFLRESRWFTRGWTLQELIAPRQVSFFSKNWSFLGEKHAPGRDCEWKLLELLSSITNIPEAVLADPSRRTSCSVARKMSWAAGRKTTREEDMAYSLLGLFDVNMPLLYGEGTRAFIRLQEEIIKETDDQSLFAWGLSEFDAHWHQYAMKSLEIGILAPDPTFFAMSGKVVPFPSEPNRQPYTITNKGLRIDLRFLKGTSENRPYSVALLDCHYEDDFSGVIGIALKQTSNASIFTRQLIGSPNKWGTEEIEDAEVRTIYVSKHISGEQRKHKYQDIKCLIRCDALRNSGCRVLKVLPSSSRWNEETGVLILGVDNSLRGRFNGARMIIVVFNEQFDHKFALVLSLIDHPGLPRDEGQSLGRAVRIMPQLDNLSHELLKDGRENELDIEWENDWGTERAWKCEDTQLLNVYRHTQGTRTMKITAVSSEVEILNKRVFVLDVDCNWVIPPSKDETAERS